METEPRGWLLRALESLWRDGRMFGSEAEFQFALAWELQRLLPRERLRLEYTPWELDAAMHIDLVVCAGGRMVPVELKYKTRGFSGRNGAERVILRDHGAQDLGRYDFLQDIQRMERFVGCGRYPAETAFAVLLTNDPAYWKPPASPRPTADAAFRIHEGVTLSGRRCWGTGAGAGTRRTRAEPITLRGTYPMVWWDCVPQPACPFRYTVVEIRKDALQPPAIPH